MNPFHLTIITIAVHRLMASHSERAIFQELERDYNILARPVRNASLPVQISLGITLQNIIDMDEKNQILTLNVWLQYVSSLISQSINQIVMARLPTNVGAPRARKHHRRSISILHIMETGCSPVQQC